MNHELDEIEAVARQVGLYNVKYVYNNEEYVTTLLLKIGKKNIIRKIIIIKQVNIPLKSISKIKLMFRNKSRTIILVMKDKENILMTLDYKGN